MNLYDPGQIGGNPWWLWLYIYRVYIYLFLVLVFGAVVYALFRKRLSKMEQVRLDNLADLDGLAPVGTGSLDPAPPWKHLRKRVENRISNRYTVIRKVLTLGLGFCVLIALCFPFLTQLPATLISLLVTSVTVVFGIAARPFVENLISGVVLSFSNHFYTGDTVSIDGHYGTIEDISLTHTTIKLWDWRRYVIPNQRMLTKEVINYSHTQDNYIWSKIDFSVSYDTDLKAVEEVALEIAANNPWCRGEAMPELWVMELRPESVFCWLAAWTQTPAESWDWKAHVRYHLAIKFREMGIKAHVYHSDSGDMPAPLKRFQNGPD